MQLEPECIGCIFDQMLRAFKLLSPNLPREKIISAQMKLMEYLQTVDINKNSSPIIGKTAYKLVAETIGVDDPYKKLKEKYNALALNIYEDVKGIIKKSEDPLFEAILVSALGNTIDLAAQHKIDIIKDIETFTPDDLVLNSYPEFLISLKLKSKLLILGDNAGEIVFDKLLIEVLQEKYPKLEIVYSVRSGPIINDVTYKDAANINLTKIVRIVESTATPGIELSLASDEFKNVFYDPSVIILSKGQGNFESLYGIEIPSKDVFYLLKAKCSLMERIFKVRIGNLIFKKKNSDY